MKKFSELSKKAKVTSIITVITLIIIITLAIVLPLTLAKPDNADRTVYDRVKTTKMNNFTYLNQSAEHEQVVFIGDSITEIYNIGDLYAGYTKSTGKIVYNRGISGDTSNRLLERLYNNALNIKPSHLVILIGTNDIALQIPNSTIADNVRAMLETAKEKSPDTKVILQAVYPTNKEMKDSTAGLRKNSVIAELNLLLQKISVNYGAEWIDLTKALSDDKGNLKEEYCYDGLHLNAQGYSVVTQNILPLLI